MQRSAGYNSQAQRHAVGDGRMRAADAAVRSSVMPRDDAFAGVAASTAIPAAVRNEMRRADRGQGTSIVLVKDKKDRATVEQALDPKTRLVLFKMLNFGLFSAIHGCVSTGKEANVYYAVTSQGGDLAIKVYKTSVLVFKDRDRYVTGDYRFRNGYCRCRELRVKGWVSRVGVTEHGDQRKSAAASVRCLTLTLHLQE